MVEHINVDSHKLMFHPERVSEWIEKGDCFPVYVEIGLTNVCNHKCIFCGLDWARGNNSLKTDVLLENLKDMAEQGVKSVCFSGAGEPLLHKDFSLIVRKTKEYGIDVSFSTNVVLFNEKKAEETLPYASWIRFSLDAATPEIHSRIHGTSEKDFNIIIDNLSKAVEIKKKNNFQTTLGVQFLLINENAHELLELAEICKKLGVDNLQVKPYSQNPNSINKFSPDYNRLAVLKYELDKISSENFKVFFRINRMESVSNEQNYKVCHGLPFFAIINEKGNVMPCHLYYDMPEFSYGNIYEKDFSQIWVSEKRKEVLKKIQHAGIHDCKKGCRLDLTNKYLHRLKNPSPHDNFI
ncbi:MAG: radical SAM protein [Nanoarchaeota archaeon]